MASTLRRFSSERTATGPEWIKLALEIVRNLAPIIPGYDKLARPRAKRHPGNSGIIL